MEGGAMRGLFSAGVADVFIEEGIEFDGLVGVSAGACFGCNVKSRQIGRTLRYNVKYCNDKRYCSFSNLLKTGDMFGVDFCYRQLPFELDVFDMKTFAENPMEFYVVCTDVKTGKAIYKKCEKADEEDLTYFRASASMPLVSTVVNAPDGSLLLDGGVSDSIPLEFFEKKGYSKNVVILTQPRGYVKGKNGSAAYDCETGEFSFFFSDHVDGFYYGTGDVFASALLGAILNEKSVSDSIKIAVDFTIGAIRRTYAAGTDKRYGVHFESELPSYIRALGKL